MENMKAAVHRTERGLKLYRIQCLAHLGHGTVEVINGIFGSLGLVP